MPKGKSRSRRPISRRAPSWIRYNPQEVEAFIINLAKNDVSPSKIGVILRDQYSIPLVKPIIGKSITRILKEAKLEPSIPEDLNNLINMANRLERHLYKNKSDTANKHSLELTRSKIRRLSKYYIKKDALPENWKYKPEVIVT